MGRLSRLPAGAAPLSLQVSNNGKPAYLKLFAEGIAKSQSFDQGRHDLHPLTRLSQSARRNCATKQIIIYDHIMRNWDAANLFSGAKWAYPAGDLVMHGGSHFGTPSVSVPFSVPANPSRLKRGNSNCRKYQHQQIQKEGGKTDFRRQTSFQGLDEPTTMRRCCLKEEESFRQRRARSVLSRRYNLNSNPNSNCPKPLPFSPTVSPPFRLGHNPLFLVLPHFRVACQLCIVMAKLSVVAPVRFWGIVHDGGRTGVAALDPSSRRSLKWLRSYRAD